uniref:Putative secreted protein n=1 Tax=Ixodes ricinus TaxID=34613 RepID=A0A6B0TZA3_IXORI
MFAGVVKIFTITTALLVRLTSHATCVWLTSPTPSRTAVASARRPRRSGSGGFGTFLRRRARFARLGSAFFVEIHFRRDGVRCGSVL